MAGQAQAQAAQGAARGVSGLSMARTRGRFQQPAVPGSSPGEAPASAVPNRPASPATQSSGGQRVVNLAPAHLPPVRARGRDALLPRQRQPVACTACPAVRRCDAQRKCPAGGRWFARRSCPARRSSRRCSARRVPGGLWLRLRDALVHGGRVTRAPRIDPGGQARGVTEQLANGDVLLAPGGEGRPVTGGGGIESNWPRSASCRHGRVVTTALVSDARSNTVSIRHGVVPGLQCLVAEGLAVEDAPPWPTSTTAPGMCPAWISSCTIRSMDSRSATPVRCPCPTAGPGRGR